MELPVPTYVAGSKEKERASLAEILKVNYGLHLKTFSNLLGYWDINYQITVTGEHTNPYIDELPSFDFCLKIIHPDDSKNPLQTVAINAAMKHAQSRGVSTQTVITALNGEDISYCTSTDNGIQRNHVVCLRTFAPGRNIDDVCLTPKLLYNYGIYMAHVMRAMEGFHHRFHDTFDFIWDVKNLSNFREMSPSIPDEGNRELAEFCLDIVPHMYKEKRDDLAWVALEEAET